MTKTIGILAGKGGVGKTTVSINLACTLGLLNKKTSLVDFNFTTSHLAIELGIVPKTTLNDALKNEINMDNTIYPCFNFFVVPASLNLYDLQSVELDDIKTKVRNSLSDFDIVILDSAAGFGKEAMLTLQASDEAIFVVNPTMAAITDIMKCKQVATQMGVKIIGIVVNKYRGKNFEINPDEIAKLVELPLLAVIKEDEDFLRSEAMKMPFVLYRMGKAEEFIKLSHTIAGIEYQKPKLLRRILNRF
jgi:septum site-determining protein MinD